MSSTTKRKRRRWVHATLGEAPDPRNPTNLRIERRVMIDSDGRAYEYVGELTLGEAAAVRLPDPPEDS